MKVKRELDQKRKLKLLAQFNIFVLVLGKLLVWHSSWEFFALITALLWFFIFKGKKSAVVVYKVIATFVSVLGFLGFILIFGYLYREINPLPCLVTFFIGLSYFASLLFMRNR